MKEIRCANCNKKLATGEYIHLNIKCPRCGAFNHLSTTRAEYERHGASSRKDLLDDLTARSQSHSTRPPPRR
ncbi:Com family DNA-binding transcriptional regulator [Herbaspirillum sp. 1130]|uniref:Com family DNA-binding transcriptional regulator n=1 Tax=Herbaspirillum sp. 1130 TaxID=2806562 RepID=UPI001AEA2859|nr:Com family DNA-binding transcriptional regulator [Herbaspirillum sp. 1130]